MPILVTEGRITNVQIMVNNLIFRKLPVNFLTVTHPCAILFYVKALSAYSEGCSWNVSQSMNKKHYNMKWKWVVSHPAGKVNDHESPPSAVEKSSKKATAFILFSSEMTYKTCSL